MTATTRTQAMLTARAKDSHDKRQRVLAAVQALEAAGTPVTPAAVAAAASVSTWLVYADGVREHVQAARQRQTERGHAPEPAAPSARGEPVTQASLRTDLAVAQNEIRRLRAERDKLRGRLRLQLGAEIDGPDRADLIARVAALEAASRQFAAERDARAAEASHAQRRVLELEDELTAARESLRRAIRQANR
jgi:chromosome segregation ATPase